MRRYERGYRGVRFADDRPTMEQFLYGETNNRRVWTAYDKVENAMLRACNDYVKNMEQVIRGIEEVTNQLERNRNRIAESNNGWSVSDEIKNNKVFISKLERRIEAAKAWKRIK